MSGATTGRALAELPAAKLGEDAEEIFERLAGRDGVTIERIVSRGHRSPAGFWYDQERSEWVMVLQGRAVLEIEGRDEPVHLETGDWIDLPAHCRHRVVSTDSQPPTVWLAVHY